MAQICKNFNTSTNNIQTRVTRMFSNALQQGDKLPLSSLYGALEGLSELGSEVVKTFILPKFKSIGARIEVHLEGALLSNIDKIASGHIKQLLIKVCTPVVKNLRNPPDYLDDYRAEYGYLGVALQNSVYKARCQPATTAATTTISSTPITSVGPTLARTVTAPTNIVQTVSHFFLFLSSFCNNIDKLYHFTSILQ